MLRACWQCPLVCVAGILAACSGPVPYRTQIDGLVRPGSSVLQCNPTAGSVPAGCAHLAHEQATICTGPAREASLRGYDLFFMEVDDQGALYAPEGIYGGAQHQMEQFVTALRGLVQDRQGRVALVVYVHGWKHDAETDDQNVRRFRSLLCDASKIEETQGRQVIGLYVAWDAKHLPPDSDNIVLNATFWDRKNTADRVAQGTVRELFARIRAIEAEANRGWQQQVREAVVNRSAVVDKPPMRFLLIGHSFGGRIVYEALSNALIRDIVDLQHADEALCEIPDNHEPGCPRVARKSTIDPAKRPDVIAAGLVREADLILLVNPALEATRFQALVDASLGLADGATGFPYAHYRSPYLVAIASETDQAVGIAFPLGRLVSTLFERYIGDERNADRTGVGHYLPQITHRIWPNHQSCPQGPAFEEPPACAGWAEHPLQAEERQFGAFEKRLCDGLATCAAPDGAKAYPRSFCGQGTMVLAPVRDANCIQVQGFNPHNPVWVVRADQSVIDGHGDLGNEQLHAFVRQLYRDSIDLRQIQ